MNRNFRTAVAAGLLSVLLLAGCSGQGAIYQADPFTPGLTGDTVPADTGKARKNVKKAASALEELGIEGAAEAGDRLLEALDTEKDGEWMAGYLSTTADAALWLLGDLGVGEWDADWNWTPTSHQVYWMDLEVFSLDTMYTDTLAGIQAITAGDAEFTDIVEDTGGVDYDKDSGTQTITFLCNGEPCRYDADFQGDWLDTGFLTYMGKVLDRLEGDRCLYLCADGGQGCILLWQTPSWAAEVRRATGLELTPAAEGFSALSILSML